MHDDRQVKKPTLYAQITYKDSTSMCVEMEYWTQSGTLDKRSFKEYWVAYVLRNKHPVLSMEVPLMASISTNSSCHDTTTIPIQSNTSGKHLTYGVCLHQPLYDLSDPQLLVDWVELNLALGAEIITVYLQNVPESFYTLMLPYIRRNVVEVIDWRLKPPLIDGYTKCWGQVGTINECIYRNLYRVKYVALIDIDEFIVPQNKQSMTEVLYNLDLLRPNASSYTFVNTYFTKDGVSLPEVKSSVKCHNMSWPRYFTFTLQCADPKTEAMLFPWHKIVIKPQAVRGAWVHSPTEVLPSYDWTYYVPVDMGLTYHYRVSKEKVRLGRKGRFGRKFCRSKKKPQRKRSFAISHYFNQTFKGIMKTIC